MTRHHQEGPQRRVAARAHEHGRQQDTGDERHHVDDVPARQQQRFAADEALQLPERDDRSGERDGADEDADEGLDLVHARFDAGEGMTRIERDRQPHEHRGEPDKAVQDGHHLRHRRHADARREQRADGAANRQHREQQRVVGNARTERRGDDRDHHPHDAVEIAAPRRLLRRQPAKAEDEEDPGDEIRNRDEGLWQHRWWPSDGTSAASAASRGSRRRY